MDDLVEEVLAKLDLVTFVMATGCGDSAIPTSPTPVIVPPPPRQFDVRPVDSRFNDQFWQLPPRAVSRAARLRGWPSRVLRLAVPAVMCHAEARAQDARRRACRHRLKMVGPSKASPTQRHNDRGQTEPPHAITPPSRDPPRGRQIADRGGSPSFLRHPRSPD